MAPSAPTLLQSPVPLSHDAASGCAPPAKLAAGVKANKAPAGADTTFQVWDVRLQSQRDLEQAGCSLEAFMSAAARAEPRLHRQSGGKGRKGAGAGQREYPAVDGFGPLCGADGQPVKLLGAGPLEHNGFLHCIDVAYNHHQSLRLRPDDIWLLITMGFAAHINKDPERYRKRIVGFEGKQEIRIQDVDLAKPLVPGRGAGNDWVGSGVFSLFSQEIRSYIGTDLHAVLVADFSTTTPLDQAISEMVLMDTVKAYFEYVVDAKCGIPAVTLEGTVEDWQVMRKRVEAFSGFDLDWWLEDLRYVLDEFVKAKSGQPNVRFWQRIFRGEHQEGGYMEAVTPYVSGWVHVFFPYLEDGRRNEGRETPQERHGRLSRRYAATAEVCSQCGASAPSAADSAGHAYCQTCWRAWDVARFYWHRVDGRSLPSGFRSTPFVWEFPTVIFDCTFMAGFAGCVSCGPHEVRPQLGFCVVNKGPR